MCVRRKNEYCYRTHAIIKYCPCTEQNIAWVLSFTNLETTLLGLALEKGKSEVMALECLDA